MTVDEIVAAQDALVKGAEGRELNDAECTRYEELENDLVAARRREAVTQRAAQLHRPVTEPIQTSTGGRNDADSPEVRQLWDAIMRGYPGAEQRAQSTLVGSEGGYLVPEHFRNKIVERLKAFGGLAAVTDSVTTGDGAPLRWVTVDDTSNVGEIVAENQAPVGGADIVFGEASMGAYKYMAVGAGGLPLRLSVELIQDSAVDIEARVAAWLGRRMARKFSVDIVTGSGVGEPQGITQKTPVQTAATTGGITYADLLTWVHSVDPDYRQNARWAFNDRTLAALRGIVDGNGRPLLTDASNGIENAPGGARLLGYPVTIDQAFPDFDNDDSTDHFGVFGDLEAGYVVRRVRDITVVVDPYTRALNGQVQYTSWMRADGIIQDPNAYVVMSGKS